MISFFSYLYSDYCGFVRWYWNWESDKWLLPLRQWKWDFVRWAEMKLNGNLCAHSFQEFIPLLCDSSTKCHKCHRGLDAKTRCTGQTILQRMGYNQLTGHLHLMTQNPQWICLTPLSFCVCVQKLCHWRLVQQRKAPENWLIDWSIVQERKIFSFVWVELIQIV